MLNIRNDINHSAKPLFISSNLIAASINKIKDLEVFPGPFFMAEITMPRFKEILGTDTRYKGFPHLFFIDST